MSATPPERVPTLLVVAARELLPEPAEWRARLAEVARAAADWPPGFVALQVRPSAPVSAADIESLAASLERADPTGRLPVYWNQRVGAPPPRRSWVPHLPESLLRHPARPPSPWSASVHGETALQQAHGAQFVLAAAVFPPSWKAAQVLGLDGLTRLCRVARMPVLALGGITPARVAACRRAGASGVAVASAVLCAPEVAGAIAALAEAWGRRD